MGGNASSVSVNSVGNISAGNAQSFGVGSYGILAQSLGGGGGNGGFAGTLAGSGALGVGVSVGGKGAQGGTAGAVSAFNFGSISTYYENSAGILAQSIGGGGGNGGFGVSAALSGASKAWAVQRPCPSAARVVRGKRPTAPMLVTSAPSTRVAILPVALRHSRLAAAAATAASQLLRHSTSARPASACLSVARAEREAMRRRQGQKPL